MNWSKKIFLFTLTLLMTTGAGCLNFSGQSQAIMGMYRSADNGEKWASIVAYPTVQGVKSLSQLKIYIVERDPSDVNALYIGTRGQGMYYTLDSGDSWRSVPFMADKFIYSIAIDPKDKCTLYVSDGAMIYKSDDCTRTWEMVYKENRAGERFADLSIDYNDSKVVYAVQLNGDVLRSVDAGKSWRVIKRFKQTMRNIYASPYIIGKQSRLYVATRNSGLHRSDDGGENWIDLGKGFEEYNESKNYFRMVMDPKNKDGIYWISKYGILHSTDAGVTWKDIKLLTPPGSADIYAFAVNPDNTKEMYYTGTIINNKQQNVRSTLYKSTDGGNNWVTRKLPTNTIPVYLSVHPKNGQVLFAGFATLD